MLAHLVAHFGSFRLSEVSITFMYYVKAARCLVLVRIVLNKNKN